MGFNVDDLKKSSFITQRDVDPPKLVTIVGSKEANMAQEGADPDYQWTLLFKELDKPFVVNSTNGQLIQAITGSKNSDDWVGHKIVLYVDPTVSFRGRITGGVRCRAPKNQAPPLRHQTEPDGLDPAELAREEGELAQKITNPDNSPPKKRFRGGEPVPEGERDEIDDVLEETDPAET